ncbi:MAG: hypothetical protein WCK65_09135 [Rhodospirillaceae bacterium]
MAEPVALLLVWLGLALRGAVVALLGLKLGLALRGAVVALGLVWLEELAVVALADRAVPVWFRAGARRREFLASRPWHRSVAATAWLRPKARRRRGFPPVDASARPHFQS